MSSASDERRASHDGGSFLLRDAQGRGGDQVCRQPVVQNHAAIADKGQKAAAQLATALADNEIHRPGFAADLVGDAFDLQNEGKGLRLRERRLCRHAETLEGKIVKRNTLAIDPYPEAALAAILDCRFGGAHVYFGEVVEKPYIGTNERNFNTDDVLRAIRVNNNTELIMGIFIILLLH